MNVADIAGGAAIVTAIVAAVSWSYKLVRDSLDKRRIYDYLKTSATNGYQFRSTQAIAAAVKLTEAQVERLCTNHRKIRRNTRQKQSWQIAD